MDTDSAYFAFTSEMLEDIIKPELRNEYNETKHLWFGRKDTPANELYDKRTPGLFKLEFKGDGIICLSSKCYLAFGDKTKLSSKGINKKQNKLTKERYLEALKGNNNQTFTNTGFRVKDNQINTYTLKKVGLTLFNDKRLRFGSETLPILL